MAIITVLMEGIRLFDQVLCGTSLTFLFLSQHSLELNLMKCLDQAQF